MFKRKLFKRALPVILSVAMIFQSMPATALAAENEMTEVVETTVEDSGSESDAGDETKEPANEEPEAPAAEQPEASAPAEETKQEEASTPATTTVPEEVSASTEEPKQEETSAPVESTTQEETSAPVESTTQEETSAPVETTTAEEEATDEELQQAEADEAKLVTTIKVNKDFRIDGFELDTDSDEPTYRGKFGKVSGLNNIIVIVNNDHTLEIRIDDDARNVRQEIENAGALHFVWQQDAKADGNYTDMSDLPQDAGKYRLKIHTDAVDGFSSEADAFIYFEIEKAELEVDISSLTSADAGTTVADFIKKVTEEYVLTEKNGNTYDDEKKASIIKEIKAAVYSVDNEGNESADALPPETIIDQQGNYRVKITEIALTDESITNYTVGAKADSYAIVVGKLQATEVLAALKNPAEEIITTYGQEKVTIQDIIESRLEKTPEVVKVIDSEKEDEEPKKEILKDAVVTAAWYTREQTDFTGTDDTDAKTEITDDYILHQGYRYTALETDPVNAGEYYAIYKYDGDDKTYAKSISEPIKVTVEPASLIIEPETIDITAGMTYEDMEKLLAKAAYKIYTVGADGKTSDFKEETEDFFGVSYSDTDRTQYYKPVFKVQQSVTPVKKEENEQSAEIVWKDFGTKDKVKKSDDVNEYGYRIVFTGNKAVYTADGKKVVWVQDGYDEDGYPDYVEKSGVVSITDTTTNSANKNYLVRTDKDTINTYAKNLVLTEGVETKIETEEIVKAFKGLGGNGSLIDPSWKIYDGTPLFAKRADYKQAKITAGTAAISPTDGNVIYTWEEADLNDYRQKRTDYKKYINGLKEGEISQYADEEAYLTEHLSWYNRSTSTSNDEETLFLGCRDANVYRLHVQYRDDTYKNLPSEAYVYFMVRPQEILIKTDDQRAVYGDEIGSYEGQGYSIYLLPNNSEPEDITTLTPVEGWNLDGYLRWHVRRLEKNDNGENIKDSYIDFPSEEFESKFTKVENPYWYEAYATVSLDEDDCIRDQYGNPIIDENGNPLRMRNYTNVDHAKTVTSEDGATVYHFQPGKINFNGEKELTITVDATKIPADRPYNAKPITDVFPEGLIKITDGTTEKNELLNTTGEYNKDLVNVSWIWKDENGNAGKAPEVSLQNAIYGGTYELHISFAGNDDYKAYEYTWSAEPGKVQENPYSFTITPIDIDITPVVNQNIKAGELVSSIFDYDRTQMYIAYSQDKVPAEDQWLFAYRTGSYPEYNGHIVEDFVGFPLLVAEDEWNEYDEWIGYRGLFSREVYKNGEKNPIGNVKDTYLRYGKEYAVKLSGDLAFPWDRSYNVTWKESEKVTPVRGNAWTDVADDEILGISFSIARNNNTHTIIPRDGIPFVYESDYPDEWTDCDGKEIPTDKNYVAYKIYAPKEFLGNIQATEFNAYKNNIIFKNSIQAAGGYILNSWKQEAVTEWVDDEDGDGHEKVVECNYFITVLFPVTKDSSGANVPVKPFNITWEDGYSETFQLEVKDAQLDANLKMAVAPKSLAFNGVQAKMAVGETQQLDVKITKAQLGDVIQINYRLAAGSPEGIISLDPLTGHVTALQASKQAVTVEAYPVYRADDGTVKPIEGKGAKVAKTKITVTEVTAPVIKKAEGLDTEAKLQFTLPENGYRREIYVVKVADKREVKNWKPQTFKDEIAKIKNNQWDAEGLAFARAPIYLSGTTGYNSKLKLVEWTVTNLEADSIYVVYVRNVSAARELEDGSRVSLSEAGTVKSFVTTKSQVQGVQPKFTVAENDRKNPVKYLMDEDSIYTEPNAFGDEVPVYIVDLFAKSAQVSVDGYFKEKLLNEAADDKDHIIKALPLKTTDRALLDKYTEPKLTYAVLDASGNGKLRFENGKWIVTNPSKFATINNKGKLTFKGVDVDGVASVRVYALADNGKKGSCLLHIAAIPDTVSGKKVKMKVGDTIRLADYLDYKQGKSKVPNYRSSQIEITQETIASAWQQGYKIEQHWGEEDYFDGEWTVTAVVPSNAPFTVTMKDINIEGKDVTVGTPVSLTAAQIDPVKGLKVAYVDDQNITLNFTHAGNAEAFDIEVRDARDNLIVKRLAWNDDDSRAWVSSTAPATVQRQQQWILNGYDSDDNWGLVQNTLAYFEKTKTFSYTISSEKFVRLSAYKVTVTPVYQTQAAKTATVKTKTTNIPAARYNVDAITGWPDEVVPVGGIDIKVYNRQDHSDYWMDSLNTWRGRYFTSGNTYTLRASADWDAQNRITDTLTWKSSNPKAVSIKANPGTYTATLKAMQQGTSIITVTSKITKKVIARWPVSVKAVGKGAPAYGGEYEGEDSDFYKDILAVWDPYYEGRLETLTLSNKVTKDGYYDRTWVKFTAPSFGEYTFEADARFEYFANWNHSGKENGSGSTVKLFLEAGQSIYFRLEDDFTLSASGTEFARLTVENNDKNKLSVKDNEWVSFKAPENNYYTFNGNIVDSRKDNKKVENFGNNNKSIYLKTGETLFIKVSRGSLWVDYRKTDAGVNNALVEKNTVDLTLTKDSPVQYIAYKAPVTAEYTFTTPKTVKAEYYRETGDSLHDNEVLMTFADAGTTETPKGDEFHLTIEQGETVIIKITALNSNFTGDKTELTATVSVSKSGTSVLEAGKSVEVAYGTKSVIEFSFKEDGKYVFSAEDGARIIRYLNSNGDPVRDGGYELSGNISLICKEGIYSRVDEDGAFSDSINATDTIYIEVEKPSNEGDSDDAKKAGKVSAQRISATELKAGEAANPVLTNGCEYWYTFEALQEAYYEFAATAEEAKENSPKHEVRISEADLFGSTSGNLNGTIKHLNKGDKLTIKVEAAQDVMPSEGTTPVQTAATVLVKRIDPEKLSLNSDMPVSIEKQGEARYYVFEPTAKNEYEFTWTKGKDTEGSADVKYGYRPNECDDSMPKTVMLSSAQKLYIKVVSNNDKKLDGTLRVKVSKEPLKDGSASFKLGNGESQRFSFIIPKAAETVGCSVVVTTKNQEGDVKSYVYIDGSSYEQNAVLDKAYWITPGQKQSITIANYEHESLEGTITVKPYDVTPFDADTEVSVKAGEKAWYCYTMPASGRYTWENKLTEGSSAYIYDYKYVRISGNELGNSPYLDSTAAAYGQEGDKLYVKITASGGEGDQKITIKKPALITTETLTLGDNGVGTAEVKLAEGQKAAYYVFTAPKDAHYAFTKTTGEITSDVSNIKKLVPSNSSDVNVSNGFYQQDDSLLITLTEETTLKVTMTEKTELSTGKESSEITLKAGETAYFSYQVYNKGMYAFRTVGDKKLRAGVESEKNNVTEVVNHSTDTSCIIVKKYTSDSKETLSVTNISGEELTFKVKVDKVVPTELTAGEEKSVSIAKNDFAAVTFKAPDLNRYVISSTGKLTRTDYNPDDFVLAKDTELTFGFVNTEGADPETLKVTVAPVEVTEITGESNELTIPANSAKWFAFKASKDGLYKFAQDDSSIAVYKNLASYNSTDGEVMIAAGACAYFKVTNSTDEELKTTVSVTLSDTEIRSLETGSGDYELASGSQGWFSFTPTVTGVYRFSINSYNCKGEYYANDPAGEYTSISSYHWTDPVLVIGGKMVYLKINNSIENGSMVNINVSLQEEISSVRELKMGNALNVTISEDKSFEWLTFTAPSKRTYEFYSSNSTVNDQTGGDPVADLCIMRTHSSIQQSLGDDAGDNMNFKFSVELTAGQQIYIKARSYSDNNSYDVNVR